MGCLPLDLQSPCVSKTLFYFIICIFFCIVLICFQITFNYYKSYHENRDNYPRPIYHQRTPNRNDPHNYRDNNLVSPNPKLLATNIARAILSAFQM